MRLRVAIPVLLGSVTALLGSCSESTGQKHVTRAMPPPAAPDSAAFRSYRRTLQRLADADWQDRQAIFKVFRQHGFRSAPADSANRWLMRQDSVRLHTFRTLERRYGWPQASTTGREGTQHAYLLVQHAPQLCRPVTKNPSGPPMPGASCAAPITRPIWTGCWSIRAARNGTAPKVAGVLWPVARKKHTYCP